MGLAALHHENYAIHLPCHGLGNLDFLRRLLDSLSSLGLLLPSRDQYVYTPTRWQSTDTRAEGLALSDMDRLFGFDPAIHGIHSAEDGRESPEKEGVKDYHVEHSTQRA